MEFLFGNQIASFESLVVLICVAIIIAIFFYDAYLFIARMIGVLTPRKEYVKEKIAIQEKGENPPDESLQIAEIPEEIAMEEDPTLSHTESTTGDASNALEGTLGEPVIEEEVPLASENDISLSDTDNVISPIETSLESPVEQTVLTEISSDTIATEETSETLVKEEPIRAPDEIIRAPIETDETDMNLTGDTDIPEEVSDANLENIISVDTRGSEIIEEVQSREEVHKIQDIEQTEPITISRESEKSIPKKQSIVLSPEKRDKLIEITNNTRTLIARGHVTEARALIIEGLSLSKEHRELNIILAELYERDHAFEKAEYIYKDLAHIYTDDAEILLHLANSLAMQRKYRVSYELYKRVLSLQGDSEEVLYTLAHLASELTETDEAYEYSRNYIRQYPKNPEILWLYSQSQITRGNRRDAIETLIKLKNLTPYNQEIIDLIQKLVVEEEMAGNFGGEK